MIWTALVISTFIYCFIVWLLFGKKQPAGTIEQELHQPMILVLIVLAFAMFVVSFSLRTPNVRWAIVESSTIYGLVAAFITHDWRLFAIGWALSLVGFGLSFPQSEEA